MKKIIVFPGDASGVFFQNELPYLLDAFDELYILSYKISDKSIGLDYPKIHFFEIETSFKQLFSGEFKKWLRTSAVSDEIKSHKKAGIKGLKMKAYVFYYGLFYLQAREILKKNFKFNPSEDIVIGYSFWLSRGAYALSELKNDNFGIEKIVFRAHGYDLYEYRNSLKYLPFRKIISQRANKILFISEDGLTYYMNNNQVAEDKLSVLHLGVNSIPNVYHPVVDKGVCFVSCSNIIPVKRLDLIIKSLAGLNIGFRWYHIGDGEDAEKSKELAKRLLPSGSFHFMGKMNNNEVLPFYERIQANYIINMSDSEGIPVSIMEAMSIGIPAIGRDVGGMREIINDHDGYLIKAETDESIVSAFEEIDFTDEVVYSNKSIGAKTMWKDNFDADLNYKKFISYLLSEKSK